MDSSQLPYLKALLQTSFTKQAPADVDWAKADWEAIADYVIANNHQAIVSRALRILGPHAEGVDAKAVLRINTSAATQNLNHQSATLKLDTLAMQWRHEGKALLAIDGMSNETDYPAGALRGATNVVCSAVYEASAAADAQRVKAETLQMEPLTATVVEDLVPTTDEKVYARVAPILQEAFKAAPCQRMRRGLAVVPNRQFRALYQLVKDHQDLVANVMTLRAVVDWAMLLSAIEAFETDFDWDALRQRCDALGLMPLAQSMTAAAARITGLPMPAAGFDASTVADEDVDLLLTLVLESTEGLPEGRMASAREAFSHSRKYSRLLGVSPLKTALQRLFK